MPRVLYEWTMGTNHFVVDLKFNEDCTKAVVFMNKKFVVTIALDDIVELEKQVVWDKQTNNMGTFNKGNGSIMPGDESTFLLANSEEFQIFYKTQSHITSDQLFIGVTKNSNANAFLNFVQVELFTNVFN